ncbi:MAG: hypothetical protein JWL83_2928 [Actinomycetia bacterium]|nr:hypothetical protein [Actinomycetes bacterium]
MFVIPTASAVPTINVVAGQSIQTAINAAVTGTHINVGPGDYNEALYLNKNKIVITADHANLLPPPSYPSTPCSSGGAPQTVGICVDGASNTLDAIRNFTIEGFSGGGIVVNNAKNTDISGNVINGSGPIAIAENNAAGVNIQANVVFGSSEAGISVAGAQLPVALVKNNIAFDDGYGVLVRDSASGGNIIQNVVTRNCVGVALLRTGPTPTTNWTVQKNDAVGDQNACPADNTNGTGILIGGADNTNVVNNTATRNQAAGPPVATSGGIVLVSTAGSGGADPVNVKVANNIAFNNQVGDIVYDGTGTGNDVKTNNRCKTSSPDPLICKNQHA